MKIIIPFLFLFPVLSIAQTNYGTDYSTGVSNPYIDYQYYQQPAYNSNINNTVPSKEVTYFSNRIQNPKLLSSKYKHLVANAHNLNGCWDKAATTYGVDPWLLVSIAQVESNFNVAATNKNKNKTSDMGIMQINSFWLPTLKKYGITNKDLFEPCTSIFVGAWIVAQNIKRFGYNQDGIGAYNSPTNVKIRRNYAKKVYKSYNQLMLDFNPQMVNKVVSR